MTDNEFLLINIEEQITIKCNYLGEPNPLTYETWDELQELCGEIKRREIKKSKSIGQTKRITIKTTVMGKTETENRELLWRI